jgi:hypothetical protein
MENTVLKISVDPDISVDNNKSIFKIPVDPDSIFFKIQFAETIDKKILETLLCDIDSKFVSSCVTYISGTGDYTYKHYERKCLIEMYQLLNNTNSFNTNYKLSKHCQTGRVYAKKALSLLHFDCKLRNTIANNFYIDIDMNNAHPVILNQALQKEKFPCPHLTNYCENRENLLKKVMKTYKIDRSDAKTLFIRLLYGGSYQKWMTDNKFENTIDEIVDFEKELLNVGVFIRGYNSDFTAYYSEKKKVNENLVTNRSIVSYFCQNLERTFLEHMFSYLRGEGLTENNNCVLSFDGIMIPKHLFNDYHKKQTLLQDLSNYLYEKTQFKIYFSYKDTDDKFDVSQIITSDIKLFEIQNHTNVTDTNLANIFINMYHDENLFYSEENKCVYFYYINKWQGNPEPESWIVLEIDALHKFKNLISNVLFYYYKIKFDEQNNELMTLQAQLEKFETELDLLQRHEDDDDEKNLSKAEKKIAKADKKKEMENIENEIKSLKKHIKEKNNDLKVYIKALEKIQSKNGVDSICLQTLNILSDKHCPTFDTGKDQFDNVHFKNGAYDVTNNIFRPRTKNDYVTKILDYDYVPKDILLLPENEHYLKIINKFFYQIQPIDNENIFTKQFLRYCLTGHTNHQVFKINYGPSASNGKSTEVEIFKICFDIYAKSLNRDMFSENNTKLAKHLDFLKFPIRLGYIEELPSKNIDANLLKHLTDADNVNCEIMYGNVQNRTSQVKYVFLTNNDPNLAGDNGIFRRGLIQSYNTKFIDGDDPNFSESFMRYKKIKDFKKQFENPMLKNAFFHVIIESGPLQIQDAHRDSFKQNIMENNPLQMIINEAFEFGEKAENKTVHKTDFRRQTERIFGKARKLNIKITLRDIKAPLLSNGCFYDKNNVVHGERGNWFNLILKEMDEDDD